MTEQTPETEADLVSVEYTLIDAGRDRQVHVEITDAAGNSVHLTWTQAMAVATRLNDAEEHGIYPAIFA